LLPGLGGKEVVTETVAVPALLVAAVASNPGLLSGLPGRARIGGAL